MLEKPLMRPVKVNKGSKDGTKMLHRGETAELGDNYLWVLGMTVTLYLSH